MQKVFTLLTITLICLQSHAQLPEDVLKYSWQPVNGSARMNGVGGASGALGGDITSIFTNPAGIALYKTSEFVISPGHISYTNKSNYRGTNADDVSNSFNLGPSGIIFSNNSRGRSNWLNTTIGIGVNRTANFNNNVYYEGQNNFSSFAEQYAAEAAGSGQTIDDMLDPNFTRVSLGTQMALYGYLIDTVTLGGVNQFVSLPEWGNMVEGKDFLLNQSHVIRTSGGVTEPSIAFAGNQQDNFYIGGAIGIPIVKYEKRSNYFEEDATGDNDNNFDFSELSETFITSGVGINAKLGILFRPSELIRMGLTVHSPSWYSLTDEYKGSLRIASENFRSDPANRDITIESSQFSYGNFAGPYRYELVTPWKLMLSGAYVLNSSADVKEQKGFVSADIEYITYKSQSFRNGEDYDNTDYYDQLTDVMKEYYKNALNFRIGGELKFTTMMARAGFSYYGNPYTDAEFDASRMFISGGLGYRNSGMFIDLSYTYSINKDVSFPYRLSDRANTFANVQGNGSNVMLTLGFKMR